MAELQLPKLTVRVRFPSLAPNDKNEGLSLVFVVSRKGQVEKMHRKNAEHSWLRHREAVSHRVHDSRRLLQTTKTRACPSFLLFQGRDRLRRCTARMRSILGCDTAKRFRIGLLLFSHKKFRLLIKYTLNFLL